MAISNEAIIAEFKKIDADASVTIIHDMNILDELYTNPMKWKQGLFICDSFTAYTIEAEDVIVVHPKYTPALLKWNSMDDSEKRNYIISLMSHQVLNQGGYKETTIDNIKFSEIIWIFENAMVMSKHLAIMAMKGGYKCTRKNSIEGEWITIENNIVINQDGYKTPLNDFLIYTKGRSYDTNWQIYKN